MPGRLFVGTSGFAYDEWRGVFYPEAVRRDRFLAHYASRFPSVEINYTFRRSPSPATLRSWREQTPEGFRFALKAHQRITHGKRLGDADEDVAAFLERARTLGDRLGPILFQCPPTLPYDERLLARFVGFLPPTVPAAFEFRHPSWEAGRRVLRDQGAAWCDAETDERSLHAISVGPFAYLRLRKDVYDDRELQAWADRIGGVLAEGRDVYCYLKHERAAPSRAARLLDLVSAAG